VACWIGRIIDQVGAGKGGGRQFLHDEVRDVCHRPAEILSQPIYHRKAMNGDSRERTVTITNPHGFHLRPMAAFAQTAARFQSGVTVSCDNKSVDGKSIMDLMLLAAAQGSSLSIKTQGPDADAALDALVTVLETATQEEDSPEPPLSRAT
jgi:phosphocarrier protein HPr